MRASFLFCFQIQTVVPLVAVIDTHVQLAQQAEGDGNFKTAETHYVQAKVRILGIARPQSSPPVCLHETRRAMAMFNQKQVVLMPFVFHPKNGSVSKAALLPPSTRCDLNELLTVALCCCLL